MKTSLRPTLVFALVTLGSAPGIALASDTYPPAIRDELGLSSKPGCTLCHKDNNGHKGTITRPFGQQMQKLGTIGKSPGRMLTALEEYDRNRFTVDGDTAPDVQELRDGTNPNEPDAVGEGGAGGVVPPGLEDLPIPQTGCSAARHSNARSDDDLAETLSAFALACVSMIALRFAARGRRRAL